MKKILAILFTGLLMGSELARANEINLASIQANLCADPSVSKNSKTEAQSICPECLAGTQSTPALPQKLKDVKEVVEASQEKNVRELGFYKWAKDLKLFAGSSDNFSHYSLDNLKAELESYLSTNAFYQKQLDDFDKIKQMKVPPQQQFDAAKNEGLLTDYVTEKMQTLLDKNQASAKNLIESYKATLDQYKKNKASASDADKSYLQDVIDKYEKELKILTTQDTSHGQAKVWMNQGGGKPVPSAAVNLLTSLSWSSKNQVNEPLIKQSIASYQGQIAKIQDRISELEAELKPLDPGNASVLKAKIDDLDKKAEMILSFQKQNPGYQDCGMSVAERLAILWYTGSHYRKLNQALLAGGENAKKFEPFRQVLESALAKLAPYQGTVVQSTNLNDMNLAEYQVGSVLIHPSFTSAALGAGWNGKTNFIIKSKTGKYVGSHSAVFQENEVVFSTKSKFKVLETDGSNIVLEQVD